MKKITLILFLIIVVNKSYSQMTYFNYLDYTSEWRYYVSGWGGFYIYDSYETRYFDGDETISGVVYYKEYSIKIETEYYSEPIGPISNTYYGGPYFTREDASGKFYRLNPSDGTEAIILDNQIIANSNIGDPFPYPGEACNVETIETVNLGTTILKKIKGLNIGNNTGTLEGVGVLGLACATSIETGGGLNCYTKQGFTLQFGTIDCNSFPIPIRTGLSINNNNLNTSNILISPNPTNGILKVKLNSQEIINYNIFNIQGAILKRGSIESEEQIIDITNFPKGVYIFKIGNRNKFVYKKIIKE